MIKDPATLGELGRWPVATVWVVALLAALAIDGPVARLMLPLRPAVKASEVAEEIKEGGHAGFTLVVCLVLAALHPRKWQAVSLLAISAVMVGILRIAVALAAARMRPVVHIDPLAFFSYDFHDVLHAHNLSFPSGHSSLAFVSAAVLSHLMGRGRLLFFGGAVLVGLERVAESAHYVSDVVAAALLAMLAFRIALRINDWLWNGPATEGPTVAMAGLGGA